MKTLIFGIVLSLALVGCTEKQQSKSSTAAAKKPMGNVAAGKVIAARECKTCHGMDGKGVAPAIPNLAAQRDRYLLASLEEYKDGKRRHAALTDLAKNMSETDMRNIAAYYSSQPPVVNPTAGDVKHSSPYEKGKALAKQCAKCHGADGNSTIPGTPSLAGQQPRYLVDAIQEYHQGDRAIATMKNMLVNADSMQLEDLALYFATQTPVRRAAPEVGDPKAGEPVTAVCGGCHGIKGVSVDSETPSLAGQDAQYLVKAIKAYRTTRKNWSMQRYVAGLSDTDINNVAAYYATQQPQAADTVPTSTQELAKKCNRCHDQNNPGMVAPKLRGQDKDYLVMALRAYRDGKRVSSMMHSMSYPYSNAIIESLANWYASQPTR